MPVEVPRRDREGDVVVGGFDTQGGGGVHHPGRGVHTEQSCVHYISDLFNNHY